MESIPLRGTSPQIFDNDDFLDILDRFNCKSRVNAFGVILEIAGISAEAIHNALLLEEMPESIKNFHRV